MVIVIFLAFVLFVLALSFYLGSKTKTSSGYYAAGGQIHWAVNGIAFAGDYLSAASFLGICGMIATVGYDGFLYSIGYLAGWIVALFVVAEPLKRLGKYTFTDAVDAKFNSRSIKLAAAISTLVVSVCYLIPQMVGAGVLVEPLLGLAQHWGVIIVGAVVITIVATAGMASTTYVQFLKGGLLIVFSLALVIAVCVRGFSAKPDQGGKVPFYEYKTLAATEIDGKLTVSEPGWQVIEVQEVKASKATLARLSKDGKETWWYVSHDEKPRQPEAKSVTPVTDALAKTGNTTKSGWKLTVSGAAMSAGTAINAADTTKLMECQSVMVTKDGDTIINGAPKSETNILRQVGNVEMLRGKQFVKTGSVSPFELLAALTDKNTIVRRWKEAKITDKDGAKVSVYFPSMTKGNLLMRPGLKFKVQGTPLEKMDFVSLMLALFLGTAALPHILIRYYTVSSPAAARKSTIVAIASIGFFYILTLFMGLGAAVNGVINPADSNMAAPLLARSFGDLLFAIISAIAFATVLGTVSGLIVAASGAVAHDFCDRFLGRGMDDHQKIRAGKISAFVVGFIAIILGILFKGMNVTFLVGLAFAVAAAANLPAIVMLLFWKRTTSKGITASIFVGIVSSLALIALSPDLYKLYGMDPTMAPVKFTNPGIISIPLSFLTLMVVSLLTPPDRLPDE